MVESQLEDVFLVISILNLDRKPNLVELFILGPMDGKNGTLMDGTTKNGEISNNLGNAWVTHRPAQRNLCRAMSQLLSSSLESGFHSWPCAFLSFFLAVSRPKSSNCHQRDGRCTDNTSPHARTSTLFSVRAWHVITRVAQDILRAWRVILSSVMSLLNIPIKLLFLSIFCITYHLIDATDWNQIKPLCSFLISGMDCLGRLAGPIPNTGSSASLSVASTRRSTLRQGTWVSSSRVRRDRSTASEDKNIRSTFRSFKQQPSSRVPTLFKLGSLGTGLTKVSADCDSVASRTIASRRLVRTPSPFLTAKRPFYCFTIHVRTWNSCFKSSRIYVKGDQRSWSKRCANIERQATSP